MNFPISIITEVKQIVTTQIYFFAAKSDLLPRLTEIESKSANIGTGF